MAAENSKLKVFLCHSKDDKYKVHRLYKRLIADSFDAWFDEEKLVPGQDWDLEIRKAVREADVIIVCLSNGSVTKAGYVQKEIRFALDVADEKPEGMIFLIPVRLEACNVPSRISRYQWIDLFVRGGYQRLKTSLHLRMKDIDIRFDESEVLVKGNEERIRIPILGPITAYNPFLLPESDINNANEKVYDAVEVHPKLLPKQEKERNLFALEVKGDSMIDAMLNDGDIVILKPTIKARNGEMVAILLDDEVILKYFFKEKDKYRLQPANPTMRPIFISKDTHLEIKAKVVMVIRKVDNIR